MCCFLLFLLLLVGLSSSAGHRSCGTIDLSTEEEKYATLAMDQWQLRKQRQQQLPTFQVNMYFHVIQSDAFQPPVPDELLHQQFEILNDVFQVSAFQFTLKGITRTQRSEWVGNTREDDALKAVIGLALRKGGRETMNVYIQPGLCPGGIFGFASLPKWHGVYPVNKFTPNDHVTICHDYLPGRSAPFDLGYTLVHEVGHWLGVDHPFKNRDCSPSNQNDMVEDTPQTSSPVYDCPSFRDSCPGRPGADLLNNFMDYTDDRCMTAFTKGQLDRMGAQYSTFRLVKDSSFCGDNEASVKFELHFDSNDGKTQWGVVDWGIRRRTTFFKSDFIYDFSNKYAVFEDCFPVNALHEFYVENLMEGGLEFPGFTALTVNGRELFRTPQFEPERLSTFVSAGPSDCDVETRISLMILFDDAPQEITWLLREATTNEAIEDYTSSLFSSASVYDSRMAGSLLHIDRCLPNGKYDLSFKDSNGEGEGYWRVSNDFNDTLAGGNTNSSERKSFTIGPTSSPSQAPSQVPSSVPTPSPSIAASLFPSQKPSASRQPSVTPSENPSFSLSPTLAPSIFPSTVPSTNFPSSSPTLSLAPSYSFAPTSIPSTSWPPSRSVLPTFVPTDTPNHAPTVVPSQNPMLSSQPSVPPSTNPSELVPSSNPLTSEPTDLVACFSGDTVVTVKDRGAMRLQDVKIGDMVMVDSGLYEAIYSFGHKSPNSVNMLLEIDTSVLLPLQVSKDHMIFVHPNLAIPASILKEGDTIVGGDGQPVLITSIKTVAADSGVFAPFTISGKIVVNGLLASSFVAYNDTAFLTLVRGIQFSYQWIAHSFEFPHRIACHHMASCPDETYTDSGISTWVATPNLFAKWLLNQRRIIQLPLLMLVLVVLAVFHACARFVSLVYH